MAVTSMSQRLEALQIANDVRVKIATIRANIYSLGKQEGCLTVAAMLEQPSGYVPAMRIGPLLDSIFKVGPSRIKYWLAHAQVYSYDRKVRMLTERQRLDLAGLLRRQAQR